MKNLILSVIIILSSFSVEAQIGLRKSGEEVMSDYQSKFFKEYNSNNYKSAVYTYIDIQSFKKKTSSYHVEFNLPNNLIEDYLDAKHRFLEEEFELANRLMSEEQFEGAEAVFLEIRKIEPTYKEGDLDKLKEMQVKSMIRRTCDSENSNST